MKCLATYRGDLRPVNAVRRGSARFFLFVPPLSGLFLILQPHDAMTTDTTYRWPHKRPAGRHPARRTGRAPSAERGRQFPGNQPETRQKGAHPQGQDRGALLRGEQHPHQDLFFDVAGKRLSADTYSLAKSGSSLNKGESLKDTALTLQAMGPDVIVIRHPSSGAAQFPGGARLLRHRQRR